MMEDAVPESGTGADTWYLVCPKKHRSLKINHGGPNSPYRDDGKTYYCRKCRYTFLGSPIDLRTESPGEAEVTVAQDVFDFFQCPEGHANIEVDLEADTPEFWCWKCSSLYQGLPVDTRNDRQGGDPEKSPGDPKPGQPE